MSSDRRRMIIDYRTASQADADDLRLDRSPRNSKKPSSSVSPRIEEQSTSLADYWIEKERHLADYSTEGAKTMSIPDPGARPGNAAQPSPRSDRLTLPPRRGTLTAARLKVTTTLNATELLAITAPENQPRITLRIRLPDRAVTAEIAAKSLRKAKTAIREAGADNIALVLQGRLTAGDVIAEAGLFARPGAAKPAPRSGAPEINHRSAAKCVEGSEGASTHEPRTYVFPGDLYGQENV
jgi:hypothetical protein